MREEITEPQHWRTNGQRNTVSKASWSVSRRAQENTELAAEAIDAALADEDVAERVVGDGKAGDDLVSSDIISNLSSQLDLLEKQQEQLRSLLAQAQTNR